MPNATASETPPARASPGFWIMLGCALLVGAWIRCDQLATQLPGDDEWHSLHALRDHDLYWVFTHFGVCDHCIPLTLFEGALMRTIGLGEIGMHFLPLVFGLAAIVVLPVLSRARLGETASVLFGFLLAITPLHVYYSRFARPYAPMFVLAVAALLCFERWWSLGGRRFAILYAACAVLAVWFHLVVLPFVLAPFLWASCECFARRRSQPPASRPRFASLVWLGVSVLIGLGVLIGPPLWIDSESLRARAVGQSGGLPDPLAIFEILRGVPRPIPGFLFALATLLGTLALWREQRRWLCFLLFPIACQVSCVCLLRPALLELPLVMARYALPFLFVLLAATAVGLSEIDRFARREFPALPRYVSTAACLLVLWRFGPLPNIHVRPNAWTNHAVYQADYSPFAFFSFARTAMGVREVPPIYARLVAESAPDAIFLEAPWYFISERTPYTLFQRVHRHPIRIGFVTPPDEPLPYGELPLADGRFAFKSFVHVAEERGLRSRGIRYVLFHRKPPPALSDTQGVDLRYVEEWIARYKTDVGAPLFEDEDMCVFDLGAG